nr:G2/mitotic-specific cyclin S13-7-like [Tanacetum cinerariifolium]
MEKAILGQLGWYMTIPTPYIPSDNNETENIEFFYTELGLMDYTLAASSVYATRCTRKKIPAWTETLKHHTGYSIKSEVTEAMGAECEHLIVVVNSVLTSSPMASFSDAPVMMLNTRL